MVNKCYPLLSLCIPRARPTNVLSAPGHPYCTCCLAAGLSWELLLCARHCVHCMAWVKSHFGLLARRQREDSNCLRSPKLVNGVARIQTLWSSFNIHAFLLWRLSGNVSWLYDEKIILQCSWLSPWEHVPAQPPGCFQLCISTTPLRHLLLWMETWILCSWKGGSQVPVRVVPECWRQRLPTLVQWAWASDKCTVCKPASAAYQPLAPRNSLRADSSFLFLDKRQVRCKEESLYSEKNCSVHSCSNYSIDQFTESGSWAEALHNTAWALKSWFL